MRPIPFSHTWPYDIQIGDIYVPSCPFCGEDQVRTNLSAEGLARAKEGIKANVHMPCCLETITVLEADDDYFWTSKPLR
ncbi:hypothetical protein [Salisediminibacterium halotolerans]|uniref:Uncharacterized protein n=1 Tax=Salisediminibacterium halotolerans TaxID=517425 RepID=A0A1H9WR11_9BACI|nr:MULTISPECIES: hypothetical protein [Salisediminibacterium]RLJ75384.1 hypothetical protein BCL39_0898 [Actinophytocola xinjiangensis]RPE89238.1 hypothetical protein EDD67_0011 [Salisediminibacterium halotolerans]TWG35997.1 hypothetical protein BCL52_0896 [Salisediminibacterium halotolerans]SES36376.1 hypothetical protein SAMN05444126_1446 [Salisediminibacterium haloalkalitolerans]GEL07791.1 hypothetical protein SHA02_12070 [Salisediminibacterium halotolerans]